MDTSKTAAIDNALVSRTAILTWIDQEADKIRNGKGAANVIFARLSQLQAVKEAIGKL